MGDNGKQHGAAKTAMMQLMAGGSAGE